jgi:hypothetical protein
MFHAAHLILFRPVLRDSQCRRGAGRFPRTAGSRLAGRFWGRTARSSSPVCPTLKQSHDRQGVPHEDGVEGGFSPREALASLPPSATQVPRGLKSPAPEKCLQPSRPGRWWSTFPSGWITRCALGPTSWNCHKRLDSLRNTCYFCTICWFCSIGRGDET